VIYIGLVAFETAVKNMQLQNAFLPIPLIIADVLEPGFVLLDKFSRLLTG
jgi:hypothetical protein